jgi:hypothetical protein
MRRLRTGLRTDARYAFFRLAFADAAQVTIAFRATSARPDSLRASFFPQLRFIAIMPAGNFAPGFFFAG